MTEISCKVVADSVWGTRLTTVQLRYPRFIHAELMTHRAFSRNASSSRAVPVKKLIEEAKNDPVVPIFWTKNQAGMQGRESWNALVEMDFSYRGGPVRNLHREDAWLRACDKAIEVAASFAEAGYHKQLVNRLLEPFTHISVVVTATEWANFFNLRFHEDAEPHIDLLAQKMWQAMSASVPVKRRVHAPYVDHSDLRPIWDDFETQMVLRQSAARCARVSFLNHDGQKPTIDEDLKLFDRLMAGDVKHASPVEHQAIADSGYGTKPGYKQSETWGNFKGWYQWRQNFNDESFKGGIDAIASEIERRKEQRGLSW